MNIGVLGLGYVGTVTAACLAKMGHYVLGVDIDQKKVELINSGKAPFFEPGLASLVWDQVQADNLQATMRTEDLAICDIVLICVGTPPLEGGGTNMEMFIRAVNSIDGIFQDENAIVVIRSTVPPGSCELLQAGDNVKARVIFAPEFLREGSSIEDFENPGIAVIGTSKYVTDTASVRVGSVLFPSTFYKVVNFADAELLKLACNAFHALKISFANEIAAIADTREADGFRVMQLLADDKKLNASAAYLRPGFAWGGSCLPKDVAALVHMASEDGIATPILDNLSVSNEEHIARAVREIRYSGFNKIGILGLAFKEDTDDLRNSPTVTLVRVLSLGTSPIEDIKIYAPNLSPNLLIGTNAEELTGIVDFRQMLVSFEELLVDRELIVITHKLKDDISGKLYTRAKNYRIIDLSGHYTNA